MKTRAATLALAALLLAVGAFAQSGQAQSDQPDQAQKDQTRSDQTQSDQTQSEKPTEEKAESAPPSIYELFLPEQYKREQHKRAAPQTRVAPGKRSANCLVQRGVLTMRRDDGTCDVARQIATSPPCVDEENCEALELHREALGDPSVQLANPEPYAFWSEADPKLITDPEEGDEAVGGFEGLQPVDIGTATEGTPVEEDDDPHVDDPEQ